MCQVPIEVRALLFQSGVTGLILFYEERNEMSRTKNNEPKKKNTGQFKKGNKVGEETQFEKDNKAACKYKPEYCEKLIDYFNQPATRVEYKETYYKGELNARIPIVMPAEYPTFELFAAMLGVSVRTLKNWCDKYPRFADCYARAKEIQYGKLTSLAVTGLYNPVYAKFEAVNNHDKKDKSEVEQKVSGTVNAVDDKTLRLIERVERRLDGNTQDNKY